MVKIYVFWSIWKWAWQNGSTAPPGTQPLGFPRFLLFFYVWRSGRHLLQLYWIWLQRCLPLKLPNCFVDSNTSPTPPSAQWWEDDEWIFVFVRNIYFCVNYPFNCRYNFPSDFLSNTRNLLGPTLCGKITGDSFRGVLGRVTVFAKTFIISSNQISRLSENTRVWFITALKG